MQNNGISFFSTLNNFILRIAMKTKKVNEAIEALINNNKGAGTSNNTLFATMCVVDDIICCKIIKRYINQPIPIL